MFLLWLFWCSVGCGWKFLVKHFRNVELSSTVVLRKPEFTARPHGRTELTPGATVAAPAALLLWSDDRAEQFLVLFATKNVTQSDNASMGFLFTVPHHIPPLSWSC